MSRLDDPGFLHLNADGRWPGFTLRGLDACTAGELTLAVLRRPGAPRACRLRSRP